MRSSGIPLLTLSVFVAVLSFGCKSESTEPTVDVQLEKASIFPGAAGLMDIEITGNFVVRNTGQSVFGFDGVQAEFFVAGERRCGTRTTFDRRVVLVGSSTHADVRTLDCQFAHVQGFPEGTTIAVSLLDHTNTVAGPMSMSIPSTMLIPNAR